MPSKGSINNHLLLKNKRDKRVESGGFIEHIRIHIEGRE